MAKGWYFILATVIVERAISVGGASREVNNFVSHLQPGSSFSAHKKRNQLTVLNASIMLSSWTTVPAKGHSPHGSTEVHQLECSGTAPSSVLEYQ
jgi:hypothetical protein